MLVARRFALFRTTGGHRRAWRKTEITRDDHIACRRGQRRVIHDSVNKIFYIIGVIVVVVIVLKLLHLF